jgi:carbon storage regulator
MLVLSRHRDETIIIGDDIEITVVDIRGDKVRLGIQAPSHISFHRKEVYEAIKRENEQAARLSGPNLSAIRTNIRTRPGKPATPPPATRINPDAGDRRESA